MKSILISSIILGGLLCAPLTRAQCCDTKQANAACVPDSCKVALKITGMSCPMCAASVERSLKKVDGVKTAEVSLEKGTAVVTVDPAKMNAAKIMQAVADAGSNWHPFQAEIGTTTATAPERGKASAKNDGCCPAPAKGTDKTS